MNQNRFHRFDPQQIRKCLSPFAQSVLDVMMLQRQQSIVSPNEHPQNGFGSHRSYDTPGIAQLAPRYKRSSHISAPRAKYERVLTFNDSNVTPTNHSVMLTTDNQKTIDTTFDHGQSALLNFDKVRSTDDEMPTSINLIKTIESATKEKEPCNYSREDLFNTKAEKDLKLGGQNKVYDLYNKVSDEGDQMDINVTKQLDMLKLRERTIVNTDKDINWDDIFDTEMFKDLESNAKENEDFINTAQEKFNIPCENMQDTPGHSKRIRIIRDEIVVEGKQENNKKRKQETKITDTVPKKVKKVASENVMKPRNKSFRKQTFTKTVNNWLKDLDPCNPVDEEPAFDVKPETDIASEKTIEASTNMFLTMEDCLRKDNATEENQPIESKLDKKPPKISKAKAKSTKKVVQSQLANKDGVMKFKKPKSKSISENKEQTDMISAEPTKFTKDNNKKTKPKFIAPIKSQVPVKDVTFKVVNIDYKNYTQHLNNIANSSEIILVLMYSNGFCQLNSQHTDDTLIAEGLMMMNVEEEFYYLKHADFPNDQIPIDILPNMLSSTKIISYEAKKVLIYMATYFGLELHQNKFNIIDAKLGGSLIDPDNPPENFSDLQKLLSFTPEFTIATECVLQKAAWYIILLKECGDKLQTVLIDQLLWNIFVDLEMQLLPIIADMEGRGVTVDLDKLKSMESLLQDKIKSVEQDCYKAAGKTFQINSPLQVRTILYDELKLDSIKNVKIRETILTGAKSTSENMLRSLMAVHPLPKLILEYRHLHKAQATFLTGIALHVNNGVVKPNWVQTAAATGRIASNNPNLQAIPKAPFSLVMFPDPGDTERQLQNFRSVYVARPGYRLLAADFQQVECRIFAHAAADTSLLEILRGNGDLFRVLAAKWLNKQEEQVSSEDRDRTKRIVYASLYGAGTRKLMDILDVSYEQTLAITASFNRTFPSLKSFGREVVSRCASAGGRLATLGGRARHFKHISSNDFALKSHAERQAVNFVIQGSAADLCKTAMVQSSRRLRTGSPGIECRLLLQIHDELVWEVWEPHLETAAERDAEPNITKLKPRIKAISYMHSKFHSNPPRHFSDGCFLVTLTIPLEQLLYFGIEAIIREVMEGCGRDCGMSIKLPVAMSHGLNWGEMENLSSNV